MPGHAPQHASPDAPRVLYSFPHPLGSVGIGATAWHQVRSLATAGAEVHVVCGSLARPGCGAASVRQLLRVLGVRVRTRPLGSYRTLALHDYRTARMLRSSGRRYDVVHLWPSAALHTIRAARDLGIPSVLERPSAHTRYVFDITERESRALNITLPHDHYAARDERRLAREEREFDEADVLLCPSDFVVETFVNAGFAPAKLQRHRYGVDLARFAQERAGIPRSKTQTPALIAAFVGECSPLKGLHHAIDAWFASGAHEAGELRIAGGFVPGYREAIGDRLNHPSIRVMGFVSDVPALLRGVDVLLLPSAAEGSAIVTYEARAAGCVLVVSSASGAMCTDGVDALLHPPLESATLARHLARLIADRPELERLRSASLASVSELDWSRAAEPTLRAYEHAMKHR